MGFPKVITKPRLIGLLTILVVGFLVLRSGDDAPDSGDRDGGSESATDRQLQPREPAFLTPSRDYGIAEQPGTGRASSPRDIPGSYPRSSYPDGYPGRDWTASPYGSQAQIRTNGYRFRPLDEKVQTGAKARSSDQYVDRHSDQYRTPYTPNPWDHPYPNAQPRSAPAVPYSTTPAYPDPQQETYSFRPLEKSPGARGRWQGPYQEPGRRFDQYPMDPWTSPPHPQWGSMPPSQRMYPNRHRNPGRRLTAR